MSSSEGVALLPFVDERRLRAALADVYPNLTAEEGEQVDWEEPSVPYFSLSCPCVLTRNFQCPLSYSQCPKCFLLGLISGKRNSLGSDVLFVGRTHPLFDFLQELYRTEALEVSILPAGL